MKENHNYIGFNHPNKLINEKNNEEYNNLLQKISEFEKDNQQLQNALIRSINEEATFGKNSKRNFNNNDIDNSNISFSTNNQAITTSQLKYTQTKDKSKSKKKYNENN